MTLDREEALDRCLEAVRAGQSVEEAPRAFPDFADDLRPLISLATDLEALPDPAPSLQGMMRAMAHVSTQDAKKEQGRYEGQVQLFPRLLMRVAASLAFIVLLGWGTTIASSEAAPGDFLYPVKRFTEQVRFFLTLNSANQAELRIVFSEERLGEALKKHTRGDGIDEKLLTTMLEEARLAVAEVGDLPVSERKRIVARAASASRYQKDVLADIKARATESERQQIDGWMDRCDARWQWMTEVRRDSGEVGDDAPAASENWRDNWMQDCPMW